MKQFTCPECGSHHFGTSNCTGPQDTWIRHCHGYYDDGRRCDFSFAVADDHKYFADEPNGSKEIDMELRKEYEETIDAGIAAFAANGVMSDALKVAVERCQQLADRPPRELTDADIHKAVSLHGYVAADGGMLHKMLKAFEAAVHAKQREPQVVKFRAARNKASGDLDVFRLDDRYRETAGWEWLEPAQEFEVRI